MRGNTLRGNALDAQAARAFVRAVEFIEQNYSLPYMRRRLVPQACTTKYTLTGADAERLKSVEELRYFDGDGAKHRIQQVSPDEIVSNRQGISRGFEQFSSTDGGGVMTVELIFDAPFSPAQDVELQGFFYSTVDLSAPGDQSLWLINRAQSALMARTMINLAPVMRDTTVLQMYQALWQESIGALIGAVSEGEQAGR